MNHLYYKIRKTISRMKNDNINNLNKNCKQIGGNDYYKKYIKYKIKYSKLKHNNRL